MTRTLMLTAALLAAVVVSACGTRVEPQLTTFEYQRKTMTAPEQAAVSSALTAGSVTLPDIRVASGPVCQFASNVSAPVTNDVDVNGDPRSQTANIRLDATNDLTRPSNDCPANVSVEPTILTIQTDGNIRVGPPFLGSGTAEVEIGGETFSSLGLFFKFVLASYDGDYTTGSFEFIAKNLDNAADNRVIIVHNGNFALDD